ncbi:thermonuclease family protein [Hansschlegelia plantiphila]|nr:thermonuclease family protein [Hansschlegelia plantiphila]
MSARGSFVVPHAALLLSVAIALVAGRATAAPCALAVMPETVAVERAIDGDTVLLDDGREVRLAGVSAPKTPLGRKPEEWPLDAASREALESAAGGQVLELRLASRPTDRYGRLVGFLAPIEGPDHAGMAVALLAQGWLRTTGEERDCGATLREAEGQAIARRLGLWSEPYYEVRNAEDGASLSSAAGRFVVAEGRVASVRQAAGRFYVNFGARWRDALSATLSEAALRRLGGLDALNVKAGARLRVRGVVELRRGPTITVTEPGQIDRIDAPGGAR